MGLAQTVAIAKKFAGNYTIDENTLIDVTNPPVGSGLTAMAGDGSDENTAFAAILSYCETNKQNLFFPRDKTYGVQPFVVPENVRIIGGSSHTTVLKQKPVTASAKAATVVNLLGTDGNFGTDGNSDGLGDNWAVTNVATKSMSSNIQTFKVSARYGKIKYDVVADAGHILYACAYVKADNVNVKLQQGESPYNSTVVTASQKGFRFLSIRYENVSGTKGIAIQDDRTAGWTDIQVKKVHLVDLTAVFGAGNEPSQDEMDHFFAQNSTYFASKADTVYGAGHFVTLAYDDSGLQDIKIDADWWNNGYGDCLHIDGELHITGGLNNIVIDNVTLNYAGRDGLHIMDNTWVLALRNVTVNSCRRYGFYDEGSDNKYTDFSLNDNHVGNMYTIGSNNSYINFKVMSADASELIDSNAPGVVIGSDRCSYVNFDVQENAGHGVHIISYARGNTITGLFCDTNGADYDSENEYFIRPVDYETAGYKGDALYIASGATGNAIIGLIAHNRNSGAKASTNRGYYIEAGAVSNQVMVSDEYQMANASVDAGTNTVIVKSHVLNSKAFADSPVTLTRQPNQTLKCDATNGAITVNLFSAANCAGTEVTVTKTDSSANAVTVDPSGSETINGYDAMIISYQRSSMTIRSDGTNWIIV